MLLVELMLLTLLSLLAYTWGCACRKFLEYERFSQHILSHPNPFHPLFQMTKHLWVLLIVLSEYKSKFFVTTKIKLFILNLLDFLRSVFLFLPEGVCSYYPTTEKN